MMTSPRLLIWLCTLCVVASFIPNLPSKLVHKEAFNFIGFEEKKGAVAGPIIAAFITCVASEPAVAAAPGWILPTRVILDPLLLYMEFAFLCRVVLSWYPQIDLNKIPQNFVAWPTEPILRPTRSVVPPAFGVDISPLVWIMIVSFAREILFGQQGIFNLIQAQS